MYIINTAVLDKVELIIEKCADWVQAATLVLDWIGDRPSDECEILAEFNRNFTPFIDYPFDLLDIVGQGAASNLLYKEVVKNILNIQSSDQVHVYMQGGVFSVGRDIERIQQSIEKVMTKLDIPFEELGQKQIELLEFVEAIISEELTNESEREALLAINQANFLDFFRALCVLSYALETINSVTEPFEPVSLGKTDSKDLKDIPHYNSLAEVFKNPYDFDFCVSALHRIETLVINDAGEWIGKKRGPESSISIIVAWIKALEVRAKIYPNVDRIRLIKLLNEFFTGLNMGDKDSGMFNKNNDIQAEYITIFLTLIPK